MPRLFPVVRSKNVTVPVGEPTSEVMTARNVTGRPNDDGELDDRDRLVVC